MLKIAVVDDEKSVAAQTERLLTETCRELQLEAEVDVFGSGEEAVCFLNNAKVYHLVFLDIEMGDCSGIDVSRFIREGLQDELTQIVYVTGKNGYDRQLFEFRPFGFIEKPATQENMRGMLSKYVRIYGETQELFEYKSGHGTYFVKLSDILYFESIDRKVKIKMLTGEEVFYGAIQNVWERVKNKSFFIPHKSYVVNYRLVKSFHTDCMYLVNDERIPVAKGKRKDVAMLQMKMENGGC
ncbi:MAG: response regulator transcription factor [Lachnospiraceae bacterium]|nr:response regulator transcription factor [Lachnospiraceae bacterium]